MNHPSIAALAWPMERLGEALELLAVRSGLGHAAAQPLGAPPAARGDAAADEAERRRWIEWAGAQLGVEVASVDASVPEAPALLRGAAPAVLPIEGGAAPMFLVLLGRRGRGLKLLGPDLQPHTCHLDAVEDALTARHDRAVQGELDALLALADVPAARRPAVRAALRRERLATERTGPCWMLRQPATTPFARQLVSAGLPARLGAVLGAYALLYALEIAGWGLIGQAALGGRLDAGWLAAWALALLSLVPLRLAGQALQAGFAREAGRLLKSRLMAGAMRLPIDRVREQGVGQLLGRVLESQALESLALSGGLAAVVSLLELAFAAWVLAQGAVPVGHLVLLAAWLVLTALLAWRYGARLRGWVMTRLDLTHDLVERMVGHRTRLAQERPALRDAREDQALHGYLAASEAMDRAATPVQAGVPAGWTIAAVAALAPALLGEGAAGVAPLAISVGGILLAQRAFGGMSAGLAGLARAGVAWQQVRDLFEAGGDAGRAPPRTFVPSPPRAAAAAGAPLLDASGLQFRHAAGTDAVLAQADVRIHHGDRILLEGPSGAGKSTLAALLTGLRTPQAGLLLLAGWDRHTLGDDWHRLATSAPQFHENHILSATLAFNLLMGRDWPPSLADLAEAEALCRELGLGDLIDRMPAGLQQRVGETGWQLSHGERSRIFLARALLQRAPLTVMDESFAALDPQTLARCLRCAMQRSDALVVIAHP